MSLFRQAGDRHTLAWALSSLGFALLHQGDIHRSQKLFEETLALGQEQGNMILTSLYLAGMAGVAAVGSRALSPAQQKAGDLRAARLFGAVERLQRELQVAMWPAFRLTYDQLLAITRAQPKAAAWDAAFAEGQAMTAEQALAYASTAELLG
jgi:hypothetical protein